MVDKPVIPTKRPSRIRGNRERGAATLRGVVHGPGLRVGHQSPRFWEWEGGGSIPARPDAALTVEEAQTRQRVEVANSGRRSPSGAAGAWEEHRGVTQIFLRSVEDRLEPFLQSGTQRGRELRKTATERWEPCQARGGAP
jgi:hypothetical protein